jgi:EAL domain-containing protein (putative c-di-GMP-specific phosphodiesterase class I)
MRQVVSKYELDPSSLRLELSERVFEENPQIVLSMLEGLNSLGVGLGIDNCGRSHLFYNHAPYFQDQLYEYFDFIKLDRFLVSQISRDPESQEISNAIAKVVQDAGKEMIASGVETRHQLQQLQSLGCAQGQGYLFSQPVDASTASQYIRERKLDGLLNELSKAHAIR